MGGTNVDVAEKDQEANRQESSPDREEEKRQEDRPGEKQETSIEFRIITMYVEKW